MIKTINVTQKDIDQGDRDKCQTCPVALALNRVAKKPWVEYGYIRFSDGHSRCAVAVPAGVHDFMEEFDTGEDVKPFTFKINIPEIFLC